MDDVIGYVVVVFLIIGCIYGLVRQIQHTLTIQKSNKTFVPNDNKSLFGNYLISVSLLGFLISYILNVLVAMQIIKLSIITADNTAISCFIFLLVLLIAKFGVLPKNHRKNDLLN
ncbi:hypothetical protein ACFFF5_07065 [Lederbergia wuyishanensis]|uniref:Membrane protein required for colicin V production n=1 Tax=Lederbergia wuyishanensis TaxID=1347903 RepID=A0ABU0D2J4_9BACI|nr:hypothetical protein [Lederbergia wuyishanensis]MCJ8007249.1 hypothetical protein [Lederbergia wuyishanensis]MDQ0342600.1 putative membrane protein required for colicin V production [Lederbergia wuyishanensis]